jgi:hypothetical protein
MMFLRACWNELRMHRAIWHRRQHEKLCRKVGLYLEDIEEGYKLHGGGGL